VDWEPIRSAGHHNHSNWKCPWATPAHPAGFHDHKVLSPCAPTWKAQPIRWKGHGGGGSWHGDRGTCVWAWPSKPSGLKYISMSRKGRWPPSVCLHSEMDVLMDTVHVVKEVCQLAWSLWPDDKCVIHVAESAEGLVGYRFQGHFFKTVSNDLEKWWIHCQSVYSETTWCYILEGSHLHNVNCLLNMYMSVYW
jgi:hypothetical protein